MKLSKREVIDATRLALQTASAAAGMFVLMRTLGMSEEFVGVLSAALVVQPSIGDTLGTAWERFLATIVGSIVGAVCLALLPGGFGTTAALALSMILMQSIAAFRPGWRYGVVAAVALSLGSQEQWMQTALDRSLAIGVGAMVGALVAFIVWPDTSESRLRRHLRGAYKAIAARINFAIDDAMSDKKHGKEQKRARQRFHLMINRAREAAGAIRFGDKDKATTQVEITERLYNSMLIINRVAEETNDVVGDSALLDEQVSKIRAEACSVLEGMSEGKDISAESLQQMQLSLKSAIKALHQASLSADEHMRCSAMVFGLKEVVESLDRLKRLIERDESQAPETTPAAA